MSRHINTPGKMKSQFWLVVTSLFIYGAVIVVVTQEFLWICCSKYLDPPFYDTSLKIQHFLQTGNLKTNQSVNCVPTYRTNIIIKHCVVWFPNCHVMVPILWTWLGVSWLHFWYVALEKAKYTKFNALQGCLLIMIAPNAIQCKYTTPSTRLHWNRRNINY